MSAPMLKLENEFLWTLSNNELVVGFATLSDRGNGVGYLSRSGIVSSVRGRGDHARLTLVREKKARLLGMKVLVTDTIDYRVANRFFRRGYELFKPDRLWAFKQSYYLRRSLE